MTAVLVAVFCAILVGAIAAVSARDQRAVAIGLAVTLVAAALLADPLPPPALLGSLVVAGLLAAALVRTAAPGVAELDGPGWPAEALLALAGGFAGLGIATGLAVPPLATLLTAEGLAAAAAGALLALSIAPAVGARPGPRHAAALVLLVQAVLLFRIAIAGPPVELEVAAWAALVVAVGAVGSVLARLRAAAAATEAPVASVAAAPSHGRG